METIFTKIVAREIPSYKVAETENCFAFLDVSPLRLGHTLVIPKAPTDKFYEVPGVAYSEMMQLAYRIAQALENSVPCVRVGMAILGLEVPHAHVHLVPIDSQKDLNFGNPRLQLTDAEFKQMAAKLRKELET